MALASPASFAACAVGLALLAAACASEPAAVPAPSAFPIAAEPAPTLPPERLVPITVAVDGATVQGGLSFGRTNAATLALDGRLVPIASDGRFLIGFDRDHGASSMLEARSADGRVLRRPLAVAPRAWKIERIGIARRPGGPSAEYLRLRERELARIGAARSRIVESEGWRQAFVWPARGRIAGVFGAQRIYRGEPASFHNGVDIGAGSGAAVIAPADGVVVLAGGPSFSLEGNLVIVAHGMGLTSAFLHLSRTLVVEGQAVRQGDPIGRVGATGRATGPHLHWGMRWGEARIDPQRVAGAPSARAGP